MFGRLSFICKRYIRFILLHQVNNATARNNKKSYVYGQSKSGTESKPDLSGQFIQDIIYPFILGQFKKTSVSSGNTFMEFPVQSSA